MTSRPNAAGFTMIEAAVALALLAILGGTMAAASFAGRGAIGRSRSASATASTLMRMDDALRRAAGRVRVPYWERGVSLAASEDRAAVAFYDGEREKRLELSWGEGRFIVSTPEGDSVFSPIDDVRVAPLPAVGACPRGMVVDFSMRGRRYSIASHFGGAALPIPEGG